ncbi:FliA/WhiG family RNA polymerase sigma factor [Bacillota bacterium LX-D]|nr:FliA/WhiG family RNA polymerase sigma factor [Bacillota bacterium LX-D]
MKAEDFLPLVKLIVNHLQVRLPAYLETDDLIGWGVFGLLEAFQKFDPQRGIKFESYATPRIKGAILDAIRKHSWAPRSVYEHLKSYNKVLDKLEQAGNEEITNEMVAAEMGISVSEVEQLLLDINKLTIDSLESFIYAKDNNLTLADTVVDSKSPDPQLMLEEQELKSALVKAIENLGEKDRLLLNLYYYEELTLKEIGQVLNVSESRVCQLHARAITRLRQELKEFGGKD